MPRAPLRVGASRGLLRAKKQKQQKKSKKRRIETEEVIADEDAHKSKRGTAATEYMRTVWAFVLEQQTGSEGPTCKLCRKFSEFPAAANVGDLQKSVKAALLDIGYFAPEETFIFKEKPFEEAGVDKRDRKTAYHLAAGGEPLDNDDPITDADRDATSPFYVLVSKLEKRQPAMDVAAGSSTAVQVPAFEKTAFVTALFAQTCKVQNHILSLPAGVSWLDTEASQLVVRRCYKEIWQRITHRKHRRVVVSGSPGIGKSWFLFYCMFMLAKTGQSFVYILHKGYSDYVCYLCTPEGVQTSQGFTTQEMTALLRSDRSAYLLLDDRPAFPTGDVVGKVIQATSPDRNKYKELQKDGSIFGTKFYYMPVWEVEELEMCRGLHAQWRGVPIAQERMRRLVDIAGRVPRYLFGWPIGEDPEAWNQFEIAQALRAKSAELMLGTGEDAKILHRIFAVEVTTDFQLVGLEFHSPYIRDRVRQELTSVSQAKLWSLYRRQIGNLAGTLFEDWAHRHVACGRNVLQRRLTSRKKYRTKIINVAASDGNAPTFQCTDDRMTQAKYGEYLVPASGTFEAIDAVYLPYVLQMTVADKHPIKLNKFAEYLIALDLIAVGKNKPFETLRDRKILFVFVVPQDQMDDFKEQPFVFQRIEHCAKGMKHHLQSIIDSASQPKVASKTLAKAAKGKKRKLVTSKTSIEQQTRGDSVEDEQLALAQKILEHRLLDRIKQYVWGVSETAGLQHHHS